MVFTLGGILLMIIGLIFAPLMTIGVVLIMFDWCVIGCIFIIFGVLRMLGNMNT